MGESQHAVKVVYAVGPDQTITSTNQAWADFALRNDAEHLLPQKVVGTRLWDHISCPETELLYKEIVDKVLREGRTVRFPFRCDSPGARRYMEMAVVPRADGSCEFVSTVLREEPREPVALLGESAPGQGDMLRMCSWCKKIALSEGRWLEVEDAVRDLHLFALRVLPGITHGICPACYGDLANTLGLHGA